MNMDQKRACFSLNALNEITKAEQAKKIRSQSSKLIAGIMNSQFIQAMDYGSNKLTDVYPILESWFALSTDDGGPGFSAETMTAAMDKKLNERLAHMEKDGYRRAMQEAFALLTQLKLKAQGKENQLKLEQEAAQARVDEADPQLEATGEEV